MPRRDFERTRADFPAEWEPLETEGMGGFVTRALHRRPDGSTHLWTSRRHRKGRGGKVRSGGSEKAADPSHVRDNPWLGVWAPGRISWWVAVGFMLGSALFALGAGASLWFPAFMNTELVKRIADWSYFVGTTIFSVAVYLRLLETINADPHPGRARRRPDENFRWFAWQPKRLSYVEVFILLVGVSAKEGINWLLSVPSLLGAVLFVAGTYLQVAEVCHRYLCLKLRSISWWSALFNFLGCIGFLVGAYAGLGVPGLSTPADPSIVKAAYLQGSVFFLVGSYLMLPEMFSE
ncbi:MAG: hypothetical protein M3R38_06645 [Actinomycetota bacterium]|nr:hypothetical protein [Actinomycetota bacterium]